MNKIIRKKPKKPNKKPKFKMMKEKKKPAKKEGSTLKGTGRLKIRGPFEEALRTAFSPKIQKTDRATGSK